ncbi:cohesin subunit SA-1 [Halichoeres trimaculatus]|uniref:cohesin subunit SA-1 n=1 Tax=Halichoeres trimaculatus TaxID=147232 RepID=UPI003D9E0069
MADRDSPVDSLEELDDSLDSGSDYEASIKPTKRKKGALPGFKPPKRPKRKTALRVSSSPSPPDPSLQRQQSRGTSRQPSARPVGRLNEGVLGITAEDLYDAVCSGKSAIVTLVDEWLDSYKQSREEGLLVLINFIVRACGCRGVVTREMFDNMQNAEIISTLTKEFNEDSVSYPLSNPGQQMRRFKAALCEFAIVLVHSCRNSIVYDEFLFPSLLSMLTGLSDSQVRAFRHTSTLLAMKLMTGLVEVAMVVSVQLQTTQRRYNMENTKKANDRAPGRLEELQASISELQENKEEVSSMMNATFRGVFVHRYRDRLPEIRVACIEELGVWLKTDPEDFLNDGYLKYLGWTLHDKQSPVRLQCVRALQALYQEEEFIGRLELFTSRFKERMLSMVLDKDSDVAVEAVNLLLMIQQRTEECLVEEECGQIYPLVYSSHRGLASAAGCFLYNKLKSIISSENQEKERSDNEAFLQILISFYIQSEFHEHGTYLVDSLWSTAGSELRDWETMTTLLCQDSGLMYEEEGALIELMMCAMRQAAQATPPVGRIQGKKLLSMKDKKIQEQDRRRITTHFIPLLPQLLTKYSADASKVSLLLKAPLYFNLEMYSSSPMLEKNLDQLLSQICGIVEKHTEATVLEVCALLASTLFSDYYAFSSRAHRAFSQLLDKLVECFASCLSDLLQGTDDDVVYSAAIALKRIAALSSAKDMTGWKLFDSCLELLKSRIESQELDKELMVSALKCSAFHLIWARVNAVTSTPSEAELKRLKKEVRLFCRVCQDCLSVRTAEIREQAFELLCDLLLLYSKKAASELPALVHLPSDSLRSEIALFLLDFIFCDSEDAELNGEGEEVRLTLLQRKRNQLAGYCKLVIYGVLDLTAATDVFKHYHKYYKDFGDIIKETLSKSKLINPVQSAKTVCLSLQQLFSEMLMEEHSRRNLGGIRELAKRLAMSFGVDLHRIRKPLVALHMDGIRFAFRSPQDEGEQHPHVAFLEILSEFSFKLLQQDRAQLAAFLKSECPNAALSWPAVKMYQRSLAAGRTIPRASEQAEEDRASSLDTPVPKRRRTRAQASPTSTVRGSWLDSSSIRSGLHSPALTSTAQRQPAKQLTPRKARAEESNISSSVIEPDSEDDFSSVSHFRKVKPMNRRHLSSSQPSSAVDQHDLNSQLTLLSLIEDEEEEIVEDEEEERVEFEDEGEPEIEGYESDLDHESEYTLPSTRHTSVSVIDELFD